VTRAEDARFGASADLRFDESVATLAERFTGLGLDHVELRAGYLAVGDAPSPANLRAVAERYGVTYTVHAPHIDCTLSNLDEGLRRATVRAVTRSLDLAAAVDAGGVVVHGGSVTPRYPDRVNRREREAAVASLRECASHAREVGVPLCLENSRDKPDERRTTATPDRLAALLDDVDAAPEHLRVTLDVGHAKATGVDYRAFVDRFGDRIHVAHLHDNDGTGDDHDPLPGFRRVAREVGATYNVLEMKSLRDVERCVGAVDAE
jgi:sugar phosphate isomerase/epimerase